MKGKDLGQVAQTRDVIPLSSQACGPSSRGIHGEDYSRRRAVVVGVGDYGDTAQTGMRSLPNAVSDACAVHLALTNDFGFESMLLCRDTDVQRFAMNGVMREQLRSDGLGTAAEIVDAIHDIRQCADSHDLFVLFYAGHGSADGSGFLVPYGGIRGRPETQLPYNELFGELGALPCHHKLLLFDCCFAGIVHRGQAGGVPPAVSRPLIWAEREAVLAATSSFDAAFDSFGTAAGRGNHSPFTAALLETLAELPSGRSLSPAGLHERIRERVARLAPPHRGTTPLQPTLSLRGDGVMYLTKPGLRVYVRRLVSLSRAEATVSEPLFVEGGEAPFRWNLTPQVKGASVDGASLCLDPARLSIGRFDLTISVEDSSGVATSADVTVLVRGESSAAPRIVTTQLPPCLVGRLYTARLEVEGGRPPLRWSQNTLPDGLDLVEGTGEIRGLLRSTTRVATIVRVGVIDSEERSHSVQLRLLTIDPEEFCEVPAGPVKVGYHRDQATAEALLSAGLPEPSAESRRGWPPGVVYVPRFFVRKHPVTRDAWRRFLSHSAFVSVPKWLRQERDGDLPATDLSRGEIDAYLCWRGTRLPNREQWEKAARGSDGRPFPWGLDFDPHAANYRDLGWGALTPVDQFPHGASPFNVMDLVGNAWELIRQFIARSSGWQQVCRGGSFESDATELLTFACTTLEGLLGIDPLTGKLVIDRQASYPNLGFREVVEVDDAPPYPQGLVPVSRSDFESPNGTRLRTRQFYLSRYMVSNEEYREFVATAGHPRPPHWDAEPCPFSFEDRHLPVGNVTHSDAKAFCAWKAKHLGAPIDLPSLAQWLSAVHGPGQASEGLVVRAYPWGASFDRSVCNSAESGRGGLQRVFDVPESRAPCGAFHLVGNAYEWVAPETAVGGSWAVSCSSSERWVIRTDGHRHDIGFRYCSSSLIDLDRAL